MLEIVNFVCFEEVRPILSQEHFISFVAQSVVRDLIQIHLSLESGFFFLLVHESLDKRFEICYDCIITQVGDLVVFIDHNQERSDVNVHQIEGDVLLYIGSTIVVFGKGPILWVLDLVDYLLKCISEGDAD